MEWIWIVVAVDTDNMEWIVPYKPWALTQVSKLLNSGRAYIFSENVPIIEKRTYITDRAVKTYLHKQLKRF